MKARRILHEKTQRFLWGRWRTEEGVYIDKEQRWTWLHALSWHTCWMLRNCTYMFHATQLYVPVLFASCTDGVGGGVGVVACVVVAHMLDATQLHIHVSCYATVRARTVRITHGLGGWAWLHALSWHTCWMLRNCTYMFHATQLYVPVLFASCTDGVGGGVGVVACVVLTHMLDATQLHIHVSCYATVRARTVRITHGLGGGGRGCMRCLGTHVGCYAAAHICFLPCMRITQICSRSAAHKWPRCDTRETSE